MKQLDNYFTDAGEEVVLEVADDGKQYEVTCWDKDGEHRWTVRKDTETEARKEFERWRR